MVCKDFQMAQELNPKAEFDSLRPFGSCAIGHHHVSSVTFAPLMYSLRIARLVAIFSSAVHAAILELPFAYDTGRVCFDYSYKTKFCFILIQ